MPKEKSAGAIIYIMEGNAPYYLLLHYHSGHWEFARGHLEKGEDEITTVKREVQEETGIKNLKIIPGFRGYTKFFFKRTYGLKPEEKKKAPWVFKLVILYLIKTDVKKVKISDEHKGFGWFTYEEGLKILAKDAKKVFAKAHQYVVKYENKEKKL